jgi:hypothetical protein
MKLDFRTRTTYSITQVTEPATFNSDDFKKAVPPFKGETEEDFWNYMNDNLSDWEAEEYIEDNDNILSADLLDLLYEVFVEYPTEVMYDSRNKSEEITMEAGKMDESYSKYKGFNAKYSNDV